MAFGTWPGLGWGVLIVCVCGGVYISMAPIGMGAVEVAVHGHDTHWAGCIVSTGVSVHGTYSGGVRFGVGVPGIVWGGVYIWGTYVVFTGVGIHGTHWVGCTFGVRMWSSLAWGYMVPTGVGCTFGVGVHGFHWGGHTWYPLG